MAELKEEHAEDVLPKDDEGRFDGEVEEEDGASSQYHASKLRVVGSSSSTVTYRGKTHEGVAPSSSAQTRSSRWSSTSRKSPQRTFNTRSSPPPILTAMPGIHLASCLIFND
jgi:hypothetical protein